MLVINAFNEICLIIEFQSDKNNNSTKKYKKVII